jgi:hypothetical protein
MLVVTAAIDGQATLMEVLDETIRVVATVPVAAGSFYRSPDLDPSAGVAADAGEEEKSGATPNMAADGMEPFPLPAHPATADIQALAAACALNEYVREQPGRATHRLITSVKLYDTRLVVALWSPPTLSFYAEQTSTLPSASSSSTTSSSSSSSTSRSDPWWCLPSSTRLAFAAFLSQPHLGSDDGDADVVTKVQAVVAAAAATRFLSEVVVWECETTGICYTYNVDTSVTLDATLDAAEVVHAAWRLPDASLRLVVGGRDVFPAAPSAPKFVVHSPRLAVRPGASLYHTHPITAAVGTSLLPQITCVSVLPASGTVLFAHHVHGLMSLAPRRVWSSSDEDEFELGGGGSHPFYHPTDLIALLQCHQVERVKAALLHLLFCLRALADANAADAMCIIPPIPLSQLLVGPDAPVEITAEDLSALAELLPQRQLPQLSRPDLLRLLAVVAAFQDIYINNARALDDTGARFLLQFRMHQFLKRASGGSTAAALTSRDLCWAFHSKVQEALVPLCLPTDPTDWAPVRDLGLALWWKNPVEIRKFAEKLAKAQYMKRRDARDCMLLYLALGRKNVVQGLMKVSGEAECKKIWAFLSRDFTLPEHRTAALKNAYVLVGQKKYDLALSFFILAGALGDALTLCTRQMDDVYMAIFLARLATNDDTKELSALLAAEILPFARSMNDVWLEHMVLWRLGHPAAAVRVLVSNDLGADPSHAPAVDAILDLMARQPLTGAVFDVDPAIRTRVWHQCAFAYARTGSPHLALHYLQRLHDGWKATPVPPVRFRAQWQRYQWQGAALRHRQAMAMTAWLCARGVAGATSDSAFASELSHAMKSTMAFESVATALPSSSNQTAVSAKARSVVATSLLVDYDALVSAFSLPFGFFASSSTASVTASAPAITASSVWGSTASLTAATSFWFRLLAAATAMGVLLASNDSSGSNGFAWRRVWTWRLAGSWLWNKRVQALRAKNTHGVRLSVESPVTVSVSARTTTSMGIVMNDAALGVHPDEYLLVRAWVSQHVDISKTNLMQARPAHSSAILFLGWAHIHLVF